MVGRMLTNWAMIELGEARCRPLVTFLLNQQEEEQKMLIATQIKTAPPITHQSQPPYPPYNLQIRVSSELHLFFSQKVTITRRKLKRINLGKADQVGRGDGVRPRLLAVDPEKRSVVTRCSHSIACMASKG